MQFLLDELEEGTFVWIVLAVIHTSTILAMTMVPKFLILFGAPNNYLYAGLSGTACMDFVQLSLSDDCDKIEHSGTQLHNYSK